MSKDKAAWLRLPVERYLTVNLLPSIWPRNALDALNRSLGLFGLVLIAATWRLWAPPLGFPHVPLWGPLTDAPPLFDWSGLAAMLLALAALAFGAQHGHRVALLALILATTWMIFLNQHRLQPWVYHVTLVAIVLLSCKQRHAVMWCRGLLISIYFFSAMSKFDYVFLHTLGQQFLQTTLGLMRIDMSSWHEQSRLVVAAVFPVSELLIAAGLSQPRLRWAAATLAVTLHFLLLLILGPFGLNHHGGVLVWNLFFICQLALLFLVPWRSESPSTPEVEAARLGRPGVRQRLVTGTLAVFLLAPLFEPLGWIDHWPAWQLYAPRNSRASLDLLVPAQDKLPEELQRFLPAADPTSLYQRFDMDRWSLEYLNVPIYPQDRFQLGVAAALVQEFDLGGGIRVRRLGVAHRTSGEREEQVLRGRDELEASLEAFRWNAQPRAFLGFPP